VEDIPIGRQLAITQKAVKDVVSVKPDPAGSGKVEVTEIDANGDLTTRLVDKVVTALGDAGLSFGPQALCENVKEMEVICAGDPPRPVGLRSIPDGVRVLGGAAWELKDKIADPDQYLAYIEAVRARAAGGDSMTVGTPFGFEDLAEDIEAANLGPAECPSPAGTAAAEELAEEATAVDPGAAVDDEIDDEPRRKWR